LEREDGFVRRLPQSDSDLPEYWMSSRGSVMYLFSFLTLAALLVWFSGREPEWVAPLTLMLLGVVTAAGAWFTSGAEPRRLRGALRLRLGVVAAVVGLVILLRTLGRL
jgi:uncharacterized membrane protein